MCLRLQLIQVAASLARAVSGFLSVMEVIAATMVVVPVPVLVLVLVEAVVTPVVAVQAIPTTGMVMTASAVLGPPAVWVAQAGSVSQAIRRVRVQAGLVPQVVHRARAQSVHPAMRGVRADSVRPAVRRVQAKAGRAPLVLRRVKDLGACRGRARRRTQRTWKEARSQPRRPRSVLPSTPTR